MIDFSLNHNKSSLNGDIELLLQQIDILFDTDKKEVLGDEDFGTQYDKYLYNLKISNEGLKHVVLDDLSKIEMFGFTPTVEVYLLQGSEQDIALINIGLTRDGEIYEKTYKIS
jgi:hypothetical protein